METGNPLEDFEREATLNPLRASALLEYVCSAGNGEGDNNDSTETHGSKGREQYLRVEIPIPASLGSHLNSKVCRSHIIVVADCSGSMSGSPWDQVKSALIHIVKTSLQADNIVVDIIVYAHTARVVEFTSQNYQSVISGLKAADVTSFVAAFEKVTDVINTQCRETFDSTVVMFMTDGADTVSNKDIITKALDSWKARLCSVGHDAIVHTLGFTPDHNLTFLKKLSGAGSVEGLFRYCESSDGPAALKEKIEELFNFAMSRAVPSVEVEIKMDGENRVVGFGKLQQICTVPADIMESEGSDGTSDSVMTVVKADTWVFLTDPAVLPQPVITLVKRKRENDTTKEIRLACHLASVERQIIDDDEGKAMWGLNILSRNTDILAAKVAKTIEENKDVTNLQTRLHRLQTRLSDTRLFGKGIRKELRESLISTVKEIQEQLDRMHNMLARYSRGETSSVSILARAHDLRYEAQFSKSRRQRMMDRRAVKNMHQAKVDQAKLQDMTVDEAELQQLSQEAVGFFFCALSQDSILDILRNAEDRENAIGFGLAVKRPEFVVDDPTTIRLCLVSGTLVSRTSMLDALEFKINVSGHLQAHNGFEFLSKTMGYATVGAGREPINAWLPLYVTKTHWERVKVLLKPSLGYFCTLDPLGFDWRQLDVLFMVLGAMIGQLAEATVGQHQLRLLFTFQRTCAACVEDFNLTERLTGLVRDFVREPKGRLKNVIPNLYTLIGYIVALPSSVTRHLLGYTESAQDRFPIQLWYAVLAEVLRRGGGVCFKSYSDHDLNALTDLLLHGRNNSLMTGAASARKAQEVKTSCRATDGQTSSEATVNLSAQTATTASHFTMMCNAMATKDCADLKIQGAEPSADGESDKSAEKGKVEVQLPVELIHSKKLDQVMEIWAQAETGLIKNKNQADKVAAAKKQARQWITEGREIAGLSDPETAEDAQAGGSEKSKGSNFDLDGMDSSALEITAKLLTRISHSCFPELSSIPGAIAFLHAWLTGQYTFSEMNDGLPPDSWIQSIKKAVTDIYSTIDAYVQQCQAQVTGVAEGPAEVLVVEHSEGDSAAAMRGGHRKGQGAADGEEEGSDEGDYEEHDFLQEDDPLKVMRRRQQEHRHLVTLPMIFHALDPCQNKMRMTRAILCQAVQYGTNSRARDACSNDRMLDLKNPDAADTTLANFHAHLEEIYKDREAYHLLWKWANFYLLQAETPWAFIGYLMNTYTDRSEGVSQLLEQITVLERGNDVPCLAEKVQILLTGQWQEHIVFARGNACIPGKDFARKLEKVLGEEAWSQIELELRGTLRIHVYRESDIPNRHGHCNSNPYIPQALRLKLGLPLL